MWRVTRLRNVPDGALLVTLASKEEVSYPFERTLPPPAPETDVTPAELLGLLTHYAGACMIWSLVKAVKDQVDEFGDLIQAGEKHLVVKGAREYERNLSLRSARTLWNIILADNGGEKSFRAHLVALGEKHLVATNPYRTTAAELIGM
jgi:hypothetical protein